MVYVNCTDRYGTYLILKCDSNKEANETEALLNAMHYPVRQFYVSKYPAQQLTAEMMRNPQDVSQRFYIIQHWDGMEGKHKDYPQQVFFTEEEGLAALKKIHTEFPNRKNRLAEVTDTFLNNSLIKRVYHKIKLPD